MYTANSYDPVSVANKMLQVARLKSISLSNLQLQKLVYLAHGYLLGWKGRPLLNQPVEAWTYGPVVSSVYDEFKAWRDGKIAVPPPSLSPIDADADAVSVIDGVLNLYGNMSAMELVNLTHQPGTPWHQTWETYGKYEYSYPILDELIKNHFEKAIANPQGVIGL